MRIQIPGNFILFCPDALPLLLDLLCFLLCPVPASADSSLLIFKIVVQIGTKKVAVETVCPVFLDVFGLVLPKVGIDDLGYSAKPQVQFAELCLCFLLPILMDGEALPQRVQQKKAVRITTGSFSQRTGAFFWVVSFISLLVSSVVAFS